MKFNCTVVLVEHITLELLKIDDPVRAMNESIPSVTGSSEVVPLNNTSVNTDFEDDDGIIAMTTTVMVPSAIGLSVLTLVGITGNVMTVFAYLGDRQHNTVYDFFILNLAITDLILCTVSMPVYAVYTLMEFTWPFGYWFCKIWLLIDFTACTEATLLILVLSLDRLFMISLGTFYMRKITWTFAKTVIIISWFISFVYYGPAILAWDYWVGYSSVEYMDCDVEFAFENVFVIVMSIMDFVIPAIALSIINGLLFHKILKWANIRHVQQQRVERENTRNVKAIGISKDKQKAPTCPVAWETVHQIRCVGNLVMAVTGIKNVQNHTYQSNIGMRAVGNTKIAITINRKMKSAKLLAILVLTFLLFWSPYTITTVVISICNNCVNWSLYEFFNWLLWMKSAVNPLLYAFNSPRYRQCFRRYMTLNGSICRSANRRS
ncbi:histamine H3 receptor-like [Mercenaria mercenaria]|uniref:histamine H3 receptor-like n=1 Tax=Mercenaria mercenaria TaxID=6596 RepID=UPI00234F91FA|nr:histamine H3 receptor-like [Mercenaria mercenaria]